MVANRQVTFSTAPAAGTLIVIKRQTSTERLVSWADASVLKASDMTINQVQQLHILEEQQDWTQTNSVVMEGTTGWNARFHRIINMGDPVDPQDAVTKQYAEDAKTGFISEMIKAKNSAITEIIDTKNKVIEALNNLKTSTETYLTQLKDTFESFVTEKTEEVNSLKESAATSKQAASTSATSAANAAASAANSASTAVISANAAKDSKTSAQSSASTASVSASAAANSATAALASETKAKASETSAAASAATAVGAAQTATNEASKALAASTIATERADRAVTEADRAKTEADRAAREAGKVDMTNYYDMPATDALLANKAQLNSSNTFTALNAFRANLAVSRGTAPGSYGNIDIGVAPRNETVQARIGTDNLGGLFYHASTNQPHVFRAGTNNYIFVIRDGNTKVDFSSNHNTFATVTYDGVAKWLGNANTATKLETARTINGVEFDGTKNITIEAGGIVDSLLAQNGYVKFANGLILQWGFEETATKTIVFPISFESINYVFLSKIYGPASGGADTVAYNFFRKSLTGVSFDYAYTRNWLAIGGQ